MNKNLLTIFRQREKFESGSSASIEEIIHAEKELGIMFSQEYKSYVKEFGWVSFFGHILTGISSYPGIDVVKNTIEQRLCNPQVPKDFHVIEETHIDGIVIWQDATGVIYQTTPGSEPLKICNSLEDYIQM